MQPTMIGKLLTVEDVIEITQLSRSTVYRAIRDGSLRAGRWGRAVRITQADLEAWIMAQQGEQSGDDLHGAA